MSAAGPSGCIGPNAINRVGEALIALEGRGVAEQVFDEAGLTAYLMHPPAAMVAETEVARLMAATQLRLGEERARAVGRSAGQRTADYLLAHRIPRAAQILLALLPPALAARALSAAIRRHAWTFAGSAVVEIGSGNPVRVAFRGGPLCCDQLAQRPASAFYGATFEHLFRALVHGDTQEHASAPIATLRQDTCQFIVGWPGPAGHLDRKPRSRQ